MLAGDGVDLNRSKRGVRVLTVNQSVDAVVAAMMNTSSGDESVKCISVPPGRLVSSVKMAAVVEMVENPAAVAPLLMVVVSGVGTVLKTGGSLSSWIC